MQVSQIRQKFLEYFKTKTHEIIKSSSLVPEKDPTLLFTNAGMNQFKDVFLGLEKRNYLRATTAQKCVRAGGKHNDLENVGFTARHHTFFEMLGNFSFGDYFKSEAIKFAWEFLTSGLWLGLPPEKLYVTVYHTDDEAYNIWKDQIGLSLDRIIRIGDKPSGGSDNFWQMGEMGPCGPCTEIFYDHGSHIWGGLPGTSEEDGDRYIEVWNIVFMQYNRDPTGKLHLLPKPAVDTGMGLERIAAVLQKVDSNYEIDLFQTIINTAAQITNTPDKNNTSLKVLADHIRSISFLIADGVIPSNEGRGYVLRRILRRAIRHGYKLGNITPFLYQLVTSLVNVMGEAYPELILNQDLIEKTIYNEEEKFFLTIEKGMELLNQTLIHTKQILAGDIAFKLYDTYGFPIDLTQDICREHNITIDLAQFEEEMGKQRERSSLNMKFKMQEKLEYNGPDCKFAGYTNFNNITKVVAIYQNHQPVNKLTAPNAGIIVLEDSVFYPEGGGQIGDTGIIEISGGVNALFKVDDCQKIGANLILQLGKMDLGSIQVGDEVSSHLDLHKRIASARNHSATHLLHKALHEVLGVNTIQKGSLVNNEFTRFDFAYDKALTSEELSRIEKIVNHVIMQNYPVIIQEMSIEEAKKVGALALFGEKYGETVRVIKMGDFSTELCGGTHVSQTGDIGMFKIISESGIANGVRRIEAISGEAALNFNQANHQLLNVLKFKLKAQNFDLINFKLDGLFEENKVQAREIRELKAKIASLEADNLLNQAKTLNNGAKLLILKLNNTESKALVELMDKFKDKLHSAIIILIANNQDKVNLAIGVTQNLTSNYSAGDIIRQIAPIVGGRGGGRAELAQAGGTDRSKIDELIAWAYENIV